MTRYQADIIAAAEVDLPWEKLQGCNILVTGATGLIGGCIVEILMSRKHDYHVYAAGRNEQRAMARFSRYAGDASFHFLQYDVCREPHSDTEFHYIIHAASNASPAFFQNSPVEVMKANIYGVANLMEYGRMHGMRRLLYVSTGEIYGEGNRTFSETDCGHLDCTTPRACYPSSKRAAETMCVSYAAEYSTDTVIARPCHTYGPHFTESDNRVFCQFVHRDEERRHADAVVVLCGGLCQGYTLRPAQGRELQCLQHSRPQLHIHHTPACRDNSRS